VDRLGGIVFAEQSGISGDSAVAWFFFVAGLGLFIGIMVARRVDSYFHLTGRTVGFIGWSLIVQGLLFALIGFMPNLWLACLLLLVSRVLLGAEFTVQETLLMRLVPDRLRGRIGTTDRAAEFLIWSFSTAIAGWSLNFITPRTLTVICGLLSGTSGLVWLVLFATRRVRLPKKVTAVERGEVTAESV
jgi:MFS family permease